MKNWEWWIEWTSTFVLLIGVALTAFNFYPLGIWVAFLGNLGWFYVGWLWKKYSLVTIQLIITLIYISGLINFYTNNT